MRPERHPQSGCRLSFSFSCENQDSVFIAHIVFPFLCGYSCRRAARFAALTQRIGIGDFWALTPVFAGRQNMISCGLIFRLLDHPGIAMDFNHLSNFPIETGRSIVQPLFTVKGNIDAFSQ